MQAHRFEPRFPGRDGVPTLEAILALLGKRWLGAVDIEIKPSPGTEAALPARRRRGSGSCCSGLAQFICRRRWCRASMRAAHPRARP